MPLTILPLLTACGFHIPIDFEIEGESIDVDAERTQLEDQICAHVGSEHCSVLTTLDRSDDDRVSETPRLPLLIPQIIEVQKREIDVARWIDAVRAQHELLPQREMTIKLPAMAQDRLEDLEIHDAAIMISESSLSFDIPAFDLFLEGNHIARSDPHPAGTDGRANIYLVDGATRMLKEALAEGSATITMAPVDAEELGLLIDEGFYVRPGGTANLSMAMSLALFL